MTQQDQHELHRLLAAAKEDLANDARRFALADCLEKHGDEDRAHFIRAMLKNARATTEHRFDADSHTGYTRLLAAHQTEWLGPLADCDPGMNEETEPRTYFDRGLIHLAIRPEEFLERYETLLASATWPWVEALHLTGLDEKATQRLVGIADLELPPALKVGIDVPGMEDYGAMREEDLRLLAEWPALAGVQSLNLSGHNFGTNALAPLFRSPHITGLHNLTLENNCDDDLAGLLADASHLTHLRSLCLGMELNQDAVQKLAGAEHLAGLVEFHLQSADPLDDVLSILAQGPFRSLTHLTLCDSSLGKKGAEAFRAFPSLHTLDLKNVGLSVNGLKAFVNSPIAALLQSLKLPVSFPAPTGARVLAEAPDLRQLRRLVWDAFDLSHQLKTKGVEALVSAPALSGLTQLCLGCQSINRNAWRLFASPPWAALSKLEMFGNDIDDASAQEIAVKANLAHLEMLDVQQCEISDVGAWALATAPGLPQLRCLFTAGDNVTEEMSALISLWVGKRVPGVAWDALESPLNEEQKDYVRARIQ